MMPGRLLRRSLPAFALVALAVVGSITLARPGGAAGPNVRGRIAGHEKLTVDVYTEAAKPDAHRWTWREPSPAVQASFRALSPVPSRDICVAATSSNGAPAGEQQILMSVTGGRITPTTIVVAPGTKLVFQNFDPFVHRIYLKDVKTFAADNQQGGAKREWTAPGQGRYEFRDELFPSVRSYVVVDPQVVQIAFPGRDGAFGFALSNGDYVVKAFFGGKQVGKSVSVTAKNGVHDLKEALQVGAGEGG